MEQVQEQLRSFCISEEQTPESESIYLFFNLAVTNI